MSFIRYFILAILYLLSSSLNAQSIPSEIFRILSQSERDKILKSESLLDQGEQILFSHVFKDKNDSTVELSRDYLKLSENLFLGKRTSRTLYETKDYFRTGFGLKLNVYRGYINYYLTNEDNQDDTEIKSLNDSIAIRVESAKQLRAKSLIAGQVVKAGAYIHQANINDQQAILLCEKALVLIAKKEKQLPKEVDEVIEVISEVIKEDSAVPFTPVDHQLSIKKEQEEVLVKPDLLPVIADIEVYYTVQILADKKAVDPDEMDKVYDGKYEIIENIGDGWYRYSFGKFTDLSKAKQALSESKTKGYVVAYKNNQRISLREAQNYFLNINNKE